MKRNVSVSLYILLSLFLCNSAFGDDSFYREIYPYSGSLVPVQNEHISMIYEEVEYWEKENKFKTLFHFKNTSPYTQTIIIGFPVLGNLGNAFGIGGESYTNDIQKIIKTYEFECYIDGQKVDRELNKQISNDPALRNYDFVFTASVTFKPHEQKKIINYYKQYKSGIENIDELENDDMAMPPLEPETIATLNSLKIQYLLASGKYWKGSIDNAVIRFYLEKGNGLDRLSWLPPLIIREKDKSSLFCIQLRNDSYFKNWNSYRFNPHFIDYHYYQFNPEPTSIQCKDNIYIIEWMYKNIEPDFSIECQWFYSKLPTTKVGSKHEILYKGLQYLYNKAQTKDIKNKEDIPQILHEKDFFSFLILSILKSISFEYPEIESKNIKKEKRKAFRNEIILLYELLDKSLYALRGKILSEQYWKSFFSQFKWYTPSSSPVTLIEEEQKMLDTVREIKDFHLNPEQRKDIYNAIAVGFSCMNYLVYDEDIYMYHPIKVFDGKSETGWIEKSPGGGIGNYAGIEFEKPIIIDEMKIMPGYFDKRWYSNNHRIKSMKIKTDKEELIAHFKDEMKPQSIKLKNPITFEYINFIIDDIYKSDTDDDTALAEVEFYYQNHKIMIDLTKTGRYLKKIKLARKVIEYDKNNQINTVSSWYWNSENKLSFKTIKNKADILQTYSLFSYIINTGEISEEIYDNEPVTDDAASAKVTTYMYNSNSQLAGEENLSYFYDEQQKLLYSKISLMGHLVGYTELLDTYFYDEMGNIIKIVRNDVYSYSNNKNDFLMHFYYKGNKLVTGEKENGTTNRITEKRYYSPGTNRYTIDVYDGEDNFVKKIEYQYYADKNNFPLKDIFYPPFE